MKCLARSCIKWIILAVVIIHWKMLLFFSVPLRYTRLNNENLFISEQTNLLSSIFLLLFFFKKKYYCLSRVTQLHCQVPNTSGIFSMSASPFWTEFLTCPTKVLFIQLVDTNSCVLLFPWLTCAILDIVHEGVLEAGFARQLLVSHPSLAPFEKAGQLSLFPVSFPNFPSEVFAIWKFYIPQTLSCLESGLLFEDDIVALKPRIQK